MDDCGNVAYCPISTHVPRAGDDERQFVIDRLNIAFQPTSPVRETTIPLDDIKKAIAFQPTSPVRETTCVCPTCGQDLPKFQPTSPVRETTSCLAQDIDASRNFNPRPPCGRRRYPLSHPIRAADFNPRPPCGRRPTMSSTILGITAISTHVPRAGDDRRSSPSFRRPQTFQPTTPVRETTMPGHAGRPIVAISTHVPRAGDDAEGEAYGGTAHISTHVPRAGDDGLLYVPGLHCKNFNPRPPCGRRPTEKRQSGSIVWISTHVPRAGDDRTRRRCSWWPLKYFNPRPPCGRRPSAPPHSRRPDAFQPTSPVRETTAHQDAIDRDGAISTHVPRAGDDFETAARQTSPGNFNPRPPCGRRPVGRTKCRRVRLFQPTSPVRETTISRLSPVRLSSYFNPRPPCGRRPDKGTQGGQGAADFNPRPPCGRRPGHCPGRL